MNRQPGKLDYKDALTWILSEAGVVMEWENRGEGADCIVYKEEGGLEQCRLDVRIAPNARPSTIRAAPDSLPASDKIPLLGLILGTDRMARKCREFGWNWFDLAGNCRIEVPKRLLIERSGRKSEFQQPKPKINFATEQTGAVIRALLAPCHAGRMWRQRELMSECMPGVSIGLVNKVLGALEDEGYVTRKKEGAKVIDPMGLLDVWAKSYRFSDNVQIPCFTLLKENEVHQRLAEVEGLQPFVKRYSYASFSAAEYQAPCVRQPLLWLYAEDGEERDLMRKIDAKPVDSGANVRILVPKSKGVFYKCYSSVPGRLCATNPVQTYADLCHSGGRGEEAAEAVLEQCLRPSWETVLKSIPTQL